LRKLTLSVMSILLSAAQLVYGESSLKPALQKSTTAAPPGHPAENPQAVVLPAELQQQTVIPEVGTQVLMSSSDANRIVCSGEIRDVVFSAEKGIGVKVVGKNAFVKFRITRKDEREIYSTTPTELFVVCGENVYNLIAIPRRIPAQTIRLSPGAEKIRQNAALYGSLPFEKKVISIIRSVYTSEIPDGFTVTASNRKLPLFRDLEVTRVRSYRVEGEGLLINEFTVSSRKTNGELKVIEKDFLRPEIAARPVGIALDRHTLKQGETARLIVVEQALVAEGGSNGAQGQD